MLISLKEIREISETTREDSSLLKLSNAAEAMGFKTIGTKMDLFKLYMAPLPRIPGHSEPVSSDRWYLSHWLDC
ncbi:peptidase C39-like protein [Mongoliibacter ruber]|uniref:Peptidase C39-like protein n=1 Tax=Mongoliibacter ruber TaxID=1750599 RepID=A0A2T0WJ66_9BACT|nr:peptidase C39-like protein [Mongoliibacter ruber]